MNITKKVTKTMAIIAMAILVIMIASCTDADKASRQALGEPHKIDLYNGGEIVKTWHTNGAPSTITDSDGWYFMDKDTGLLVRVSGTVVITTLSE